MAAEENKAIVRRWVDEAYNPGNVGLMDELFAADFVNHDPANPMVRDLEGLKQDVRTQQAAFPDRHTSIDELLADGDKVIKRFTFRGTQTGEWNGIPPTGKQVTLQGIDILRIENGQITEIWWGYDALGVLQQLGVIPQPEQVGA
jgi:steroid delta-isomerase-like uncharacterized protein